MKMLGWIRGVGASGFGYASTADEVTEGLELSGKTYLVTGCASGLGHESLRVLAARGASVIATARTADKARESTARVAPDAIAMACDLSEPDSVLACAEAVRSLDVQLDGIICNAGVMLPSQIETKHGYELQFLTNHVGHFMLVKPLIEQLTSTGRVVMLSSEGHRLVPSGGIAFDNLTASRGYAPWTAYGQSKLANLLFAMHLAKRFDGSARTANAVHPGVVLTNLTRSMSPLLVKGYQAISGLACKTIAQGAATQCYVAAHPDAAAYSGKYFADCNLKQPSRYARDLELAERLWHVSEAIALELTS